MAEEQFDPAQAREIIRFQISYNKQQIKATWTLAVVIVAMYLVEELFGGSQNIAVLVRMGANVSENVREGEYFRLLTSVFLHAGLMHVFFNTYVLFALGGFFNRILGEARYLTVFFVSGLMGSMASVYFGKSDVSVGASGAIWGLFGTSLGLAIFKTSLIPEAIRLRLRKVTLINLIINLGISFLPMIDFWAHIGGGIGGFLVSLAIIFPSRNAVLYRWFGTGFAVIAFSFSMLYAASIGYVMWHYEPWADQFSMELVETKLVDVDLSIKIPEGLKETRGANNTSQTAYYIFGDPKTDRLVLEVHFFHEAMLGSKPDKEWLMAQRDDLLAEASVPAQVKKSVYFRDTKDGGMLYYQQPARDTDITLHNYVITRGSYVIKMAVIAASNIAQKRVDELASKMLGSIK